MNVKFLSLVLLLLFIIGCSPKVEPVEKIRIQCWDGSLVDDVSQCPVKQSSVQVEKSLISEPKESEVTVPVKGKTELETLLESKPHIYWYYYPARGEFRGNIIFGDYRVLSYSEADETRVDSVALFDKKNKLLYIKYTDLPEAWWYEHNKLPQPERRSLGIRKRFPAFFKIELSGNKEADKKLMPADEYKRPLFRDWLLDDVYAMSPMDFMEKYQYQTLLKKEAVSCPQKKATMYAKQKCYQLYFASLESSRKNIVFYFLGDENYPYKVEEQNKQGIVTKTFDYKLEANPQDLPNKILDLDKLLPEDYVIITEYTYQKWEEYKEEQEKKSDGSDTYNYYIIIY